MILWVKKYGKFTGIDGMNFVTRNPETVSSNLYCECSSYIKSFGSMNPKDTFFSRGLK